jgi:hypothetical protein
MVSFFPIDLAACCADGESALMLQRSRWDAVDHFGSRCLSEHSVAHGAAGERPDPIGYAESWHEVRTHAAIAPPRPHVFPKLQRGRLDGHLHPANITTGQKER